MHCVIDRVDYAAHGILEHQWIVLDHALSKIVTPNLWGRTHGTAIERAMAEEEDYSFAQNVRGWHRVELTGREKWRFGRELRLYSETTLIKGSYFVHLVNESNNQQNGSHLWTVCGAEKRSIEALFFDFGEIMKSISVRYFTEVCQWSK
jgi:hypothetical protein